MTFQILNGNATDVLATLPAESVHCCVTSPPYWGLRDYGVEGQIGLEKTPEEFVCRLVEVFREVRRVLREDGTLWLNLGDSYANGKSGRTDHGSGDPTSKLGPKRNGIPGGTPPGAVLQRKPPPGFKSKDLIGIPWRVAFALQADGWYLRSEIIWHKPNPMPESVTDRPTKAHEQIFLLAKSERYHYDHEAIFEPFVSTHPSGNGFVRDERLSSQNLDGSARSNTNQWMPPSYNGSTLTNGKTAQPHANVGQSERQDHSGRNKRSVWTVPTKPYPEAHFATFPPDLIEPCILAGCPEGGTVIDPFSGAGTTGLVALRRKRDYIGIEPKTEYVEMSRKRILDDCPMFNAERAV